MNVMISGEFSFPQGMAAGRYVYLMSMGLKSSGAGVFVLPLKATEFEANIRNKQARGNVHGVQYSYATGTTIWRAGLLRRVFLLIRSELASCTIITRRAIAGKLDAIIYYGTSSYQLGKFSFFSKLFRIKLFTNIVEWDPALPGASQKEINMATRFLHRTLKLSDGVIVISGFLEKKIRELSSQLSLPVNIHKMPILVDTNSWQSAVHPPFSEAYLLYCANLSSYFPDVLFILEAFAGLKDRSIGLKLVGQATHEDQEKITKTAERLGIGSRLQVFTEYLSEGDLHTLFAGAQGLLAPLHNTERSAARFPLKIADYLMSGKPVVSSNVGEVADVLTDEKDAFLAKPGDIEDFRHALERAIQHPMKAEIGAAGKQLAEKRFDYRIKAKELLGFMKAVRR